jgi:hypothetical protein
MKNWDLLVSGAEFAMATMPLLLNYRTLSITKDSEAPRLAGWFAHLNRWPDLIVEWATPYGVPAFARPRRVSRLNHEPLDVPWRCQLPPEGGGSGVTSPMKDASIIIATGAQCKEVLAKRKVRLHLL